MTRVVSSARRAAVIAAAAVALAPASASAHPAHPGHDHTPARGANQTGAKLELGATVLAGGSVALLVFGTIGIATVGERRHIAAAR